MADLLVVGFSGEGGQDEIFLGAQLGIAESNRQGKYFQKELVLAHGAAEYESSTQSVWILGKRPSVVLPSSALLIDAFSTEDVEREKCNDMRFFTAPSETMLARSIDIFTASSSDGSSEGVEIEAWHHTLFKYAARDLNRRFREKFGVKMTSQAWAGWAAARLLGEAWIRGDEAQPNLLAHFLRESVSFDGQKGVALSFSETGQLRQVLFAVRSDEVLQEIPKGKGVAKQLDDLSALKCRKH